MVITLTDLINKFFIPLNNKDSIDKILVLFSSELKILNKTLNEDEIIEGEMLNFKYSQKKNKTIIIIIIYIKIFH